MLQPVALSHAHAETSSIHDSIPVLTDLLGLQTVKEPHGAVALRHPSSSWLLVLNDGGRDAAPKAHHDHYGVRVATNQEIHAAYAYLTAHQDEYGLSEILAPEYSHGSLSVYFREPGGNVWEIECFEDVLRKPEAGGGTRLGGVRAPHWSAQGAGPVGRNGYTPRAFTHGTLACTDEQASGRFYADALGLEVFQAYKHVIYVKHPATQHYVVCLARPVGPNPFSANFRYTLTLDSAGAVEAAHQELEHTADEWGIQEVRPIESAGIAISFLLKDLDGNYWEISTPS